MSGKIEFLLRNRQLVRLIYNFYLSKIINPKLFEEIQNYFDGKEKPEFKFNRIKLGMFTKKHFNQFMKGTKKLDSNL
ncbi:MAG TPA: hypothetical protein VKN14_07070, partial [Flavobacteriaceae bacterium]|nr:hypothetical protein [Flavobacteriaceae bacterium]